MFVITIISLDQTQHGKFGTLDKAFIFIGKLKPTPVMKWGVYCLQDVNLFELLEEETVQ